jgi:hypothetical protein
MATKVFPIPPGVTTFTILLMRRGAGGGSASSNLEIGAVKQYPRPGTLMM